MKTELVQGLGSGPQSLEFLESRLCAEGHDGLSVMADLRVKERMFQQQR